MKIEILKDLKNKIEESRFNYDSFKEIDYWMKKFVTGDTDEDYKYLNSAINLIGFDNVLISAWFNKMYNTPQVLRANLSNSMIEKYYSEMIITSINNYVRLDPKGLMFIKKILSTYNKIAV